MKKEVYQNNLSKLKKSIYNYRYKLKKLDGNNTLLETNLKGLKYKYIKSYQESLLIELEKQRIKNLYKKDEKKAMKRELNFLIKGSSKRYKLELEYYKKYEPDTFAKQQKSLTRKLNTAIRKETGIRTNKYGFSATKSEMDKFYKERNRANKKIAKILDQAKKTNPKMYDFIMGNMRPGSQIGDFNPVTDSRWIKSKVQFKGIFNRHFYDDFMKYFAVINDKNFNINTYYEEGRESLLNVFSHNRWANINEKKLNEFLNYARNMDIPDFMAWYVNNKMKIEDYYLEGKYEMTGISESDLKKELDNVITDMKFYENRLKKIYS